MTRSSTTASMRAPSGPVEQRGRGIAALGDDRLVAGARDHVLEEPALHRIVVDDEDTLGHDDSTRHWTCAELGHSGRSRLMGC